MLVLFHDLTDPASAVAVARCTRLARDGLPIAFEGFEAVGLDIVMPPDIEVLAKLDGLKGQATDEGLALARPRVMPPTGLAHVLLAHAETTPHAHEVRLALYQAYWRDGADISSRQVLQALASRCGLAAAPIGALLDDRVALAQRRREMAVHRRQGIGGVPVVLASRTLVPGLLTESALRDLAAAV